MKFIKIVTNERENLNIGNKDAKRISSNLVIQNNYQNVFPFTNSLANEKIKRLNDIFLMNPCEEHNSSPCSIIMSDLPNKLMRKILNLFFFHQI